MDRRGFFGAILALFLPCRPATLTYNGATFRRARCIKVVCREAKLWMKFAMLSTGEVVADGNFFRPVSKA